MVARTVTILYFLLLGPLHLHILLASLILSYLGSSLYEGCFTIQALYLEIFLDNTTAYMYYQWCFFVGQQNKYGISLPLWLVLSRLLMFILLLLSVKILVQLTSLLFLDMWYIFLDITRKLGKQVSKFEDTHYYGLCLIRNKKNPYTARMQKKKNNNGDTEEKTNVEYWNIVII